MAGPVAWPFVAAMCEPGSWSAWGEGERILSLVLSSVQLTALTLVLALPIGAVLGLLLFATDAAGRRYSSRLLLVALAVPLPIHAIVWSGLASGAAVWSPFPQGLIPAAVVHALAAIPWVAFLVGSAVATVDPATVADASLHGRGAVWSVMSPVAWRAVAVAGVWVAVQTAGEVVVTDVMRVRTFAEEVYTQFVAPSPDVGQSAEAAKARQKTGEKDAIDSPDFGQSADVALARAVAVTLPVPIALAGLMALAVGRQRAWAFANEPVATPAVAMGGFRTPLGIALAVIAIGFVAGPVGFLAVRMGSPGRLLTTLSENRGLIAGTLIEAIAVGIVSASVALLACWAARDDRRMRFGLFAAAVLVAATPGPIVGLGIKAGIDVACAVPWLRLVLYEQPSLVPVWLVHVVRSLPLALAVLWPVVRDLPRHLPDALRMESAGLVEFVGFVAWRKAAGAVITAAALTMAYSLGEVSASRLVKTPDGETIATDIFNRMHYGITPDLAALALVLLIAVALPCLIINRGKN